MTAGPKPLSPAATRPGLADVIYLLPLRRTSYDSKEVTRFANYFRHLRSCDCRVLVVDGSPEAVFAEHHAHWSAIVDHIPVDPQYPYLNGKVNAIHTGVAWTRAEKVIVADDDIRYSEANLDDMSRWLENYELVRPQNFLRPLPWWSALEASRMLLNRALLPEGDYPGTCGFRRSAFLRVGPYDGDVLFDNEEIVRHFAAQGARVGYAVDFFIWKQPPSLSKWWEQRPRQAYEDFGMKAKTGFFLGLIPSLAVLWLLRGRGAAAAAFAVVGVSSMLLAARGRRGEAERVVPRWVVLAAPFWILERALSVWRALYWKGVRGGYPFGALLLSKGTGRDWAAGRPEQRLIPSGSRRG